MGKSKNGQFRNVRAEKLSALLITALRERNPQWDVNETEDVIWGCVNQTLEQGMNIARNISILADLPRTAGGQTVNRLCGSSMQALHSAAQAIMTGNGDVFVIGGVEHMGHVAMTHGVDINPETSKNSAKASNMMGLTAEMLARMHGIQRQQMDEFALRSQQKTAKAMVIGRLGEEIVPVNVPKNKGDILIVDQDEQPRPDTKLEKLLKLPTPFRENGSITAGNSSGVNDGAAALIVSTEKKSREHNLNPLARIVGMATAGVEPRIMGYGPVPATKKLLKSTGISLDKIGIIELNEAFAAQALAVTRALNLEDDDERINPNGGAIALGHPLGMSGARLALTAMRELQTKKDRYALCTMCIGVGQGIALLMERV